MAGMPNRLAAETSPYLLQHAENPVDWWPWGPDAFNEAARSDRPVLLSIGYAACHWCQVTVKQPGSRNRRSQAVRAVLRRPLRPFEGAPSTRRGWLGLRDLNAVGTPPIGRQARQARPAAPPGPAAGQPRAAQALA